MKKLKRADKESFILNWKNCSDIFVKRNFQYFYHFFLQFSPHSQLMKIFRQNLSKSIVELVTNFFSRKLSSLLGPFIFNTFYFWIETRDIKMDLNMSSSAIKQRTFIETPCMSGKWILIESIVVIDVKCRHYIFYSSL